MGPHTNFSIFCRFGFFFVYDKEWPKDAFCGERIRMSAHEDFDSSFSFYKEWPKVVFPDCRSRIYDENPNP